MVESVIELWMEAIIIWTEPMMGEHHTVYTVAFKNNSTFAIEDSHDHG
jgi:hypothetical protein